MATFDSGRITKDDLSAILTEALRDRGLIDDDEKVVAQDDAIISVVAGDGQVTLGITTKNRAPKKTVAPDKVDIQIYGRALNWLKAAYAFAPKYEFLNPETHLASYIDRYMGEARSKGERSADWASYLLMRVQAGVNYQLKRDGDPPLPSIGEMKKRAAALKEAMGK